MAHRSFRSDVERLMYRQSLPSGVERLKRFLDDLLQPSRPWLFPNKAQMETLRRKLDFLQDLLHVRSASRHLKTKDEERLSDMEIEIIYVVIDDAERISMNYIKQQLSSKRAISFVQSRTEVLTQKIGLIMMTEDEDAIDNSSASFLILNFKELLRSSDDRWARTQWLCNVREAIPSLCDSIEEVLLRSSTKTSEKELLQVSAARQLLEVAKEAYDLFNFFYYYDLDLHHVAESEHESIDSQNSTFCQEIELLIKRIESINQNLSMMDGEPIDSSGMALSTYASVLSLMGVLDNVLHPSRSWLLPVEGLIKFLHQELIFLHELLELHSSFFMSNKNINMAIRKIRVAFGQVHGVVKNRKVHGDDVHKESEIIRQKADDVHEESKFSRQIHDFVNEADDVIHNYVVDQLCGVGHENHRGKSLWSSFCDDISRLTKTIKTINKDLMKKVKSQESTMNIVAKYCGKAIDAAQLPRTSFHGGSSTVESSGENTAVGFDAHLAKITRMLTGAESKLQIIPIVGMGGIGKTTLARYIYDKKSMMDDFHVRIWITISQDYDLNEILLRLVSDGVIGSGARDLRTCLYQKLIGVRYLIVLDDVWNTKVWDDFKSFFPDNGSKSRIIITTRMDEVAEYLGPNNVCRIDFLDEENSWVLFKGKAFGNGGWSSELEEIGKKIAKNCGGLPLTLVVVGGLLANSNASHEYWEGVAVDMSAFANSEVGEICLKILSLSYHHLPMHLKTCFLYMKVFHEYRDIKVSELIELWVSEGFVKPLTNRTLEEVALEYLKDLVGRNMITIRELGSRGNIKTCGIHDLLRQLCIKESDKEKHLFDVPKIQDIPLSLRVFEEPCFLCYERGTHERICLNEVLVGSQSTAILSLMMCDACNTKYPRLNELRYIRLINKIDGQSVEIPLTTKLRRLSIGNRERWVNLEFVSPSTISLLWHLQILRYNIRDDTVLLSNIWELPYLRNLKLIYHVLPDPVDTKDSVVLDDLQTIKTVGYFRCTEEVVKRIPNLKVLKVYYDYRCKGGHELNCSYYCLNNLALFLKLQSLSLICLNVSLDINGITFPLSLQKLSLSGGRFLWTDMSIIGSLPNLEVLKLSTNAFVGDKWSTVEGQFLRLKYLKMYRLDLVNWIVECGRDSFPVLETLVLDTMDRLKEVPEDIGDIGTLCTIKVHNCCESVVNSVKKIMKKQENLGNDDLQVHITCSY